LLYRGLLFCISLIGASGALADARQLTFDDFRTLTLPTDAQLSPDGKTIAATVTRYDFHDDIVPTSLLLIDVQTGRQTSIATAFKNVSSPRWSPDGLALAFVAAATKDAAQIWIADARGENARQVSKGAKDVQSIAWSPDGARLAFTKLVQYKPKWLAKYGDAFEAGDTSQTVTSAYEPVQLFVVQSDGGRQKQLTSGGASVTQLAGWHDRHIVIGSVPEAGFAHAWQTRIVSIDAVTGGSTELAGAGPHLAIAGYDSKGINLAYTDGESASPLSEQGVFVKSAHQAGRELTYPLDRNFVWIGWLPDSRDLLASAADRSRVRLWRIGLDGSAHRLRTGNVDVESSDFPPSVNRLGQVVLIGSTPSDFGNIYFFDSVNGAPRQVTHFNASLASVTMGHSESFSWQGPDGFTEHGVVTYPPHYSAKHRYPLVVLPIGGPGNEIAEGLRSSNQYILAYSWMRQMLAQGGDIVFEPNYRGCDNAGRRYLLATVDDIVVGPGKDIMAGVRSLERHASIDRTRMAVTGHSEGGLFTAYLAAAYHVWKTGVALDGDYDLNDEYNYGGVGNGNQNGFGFYLRGSPWTGSAANYARNSPVTYAGDVRTHLLLIHFAGDPGVPVTESYKERRSLLDHHVPVTMVVIPGKEHFPSDPVHALEALRIWFDWLHSHL